MDDSIDGQSRTEFLERELGDAQLDPRTQAKAKAKLWGAEIALAERHFSSWVKRAKKIEDAYTDERAGEEMSGPTARMNLFSSDVDLQVAAFYQRTPTSQCTRRFYDRDPVAKAAGEIIERCVDYFAQSETLDPVVEETIEDWAVVGRGSPLWVEYDYEASADEFGQQRVTWETLSAAYVPWEDYLESPARTPDKVRWRARAHYFTKEEIARQFDPSQEEQMLGLDALVHSEALDYTYSSEDQRTRKTDEDAHRAIFDRVKVWEIWCKEDRAVYWVAPGYEYVLKQQPDPFGLKDFFPCGAPLFAKRKRRTCIPVPDYALTQDLYTQIDKFTHRIDVVMDALRNAGVTSEEVHSSLLPLFQPGGETMLASVPQSVWERITQHGGLDRMLSLLPIDKTVQVVSVLTQQREVAIAALDRVTGIPDIFKGISDPQETATAQTMKRDKGEVRFNKRRRKVQRLCRDTLAIMGEIVARAFQPDTMRAICGVDWIEVPPDQAQDPQQAAQTRMAIFDQAVELLRNDQARDFRVDIESDSTLEPDMRREQEEYSELLNALAHAMETAQSAVASAPEMVQGFGQVILAGIRRFNAGRHVEAAFEQAVDAIEQRMRQPQQQQPDPIITELQNKHQAEMAAIQQRGAEAQQKQQLELQKLQQQMNLELRKLQSAESTKYEELAAKMQEIDVKLQIELLKVQSGENRDTAKLVAEIVKEQQRLELQAEQARSAAAAQMLAAAPKPAPAYRFRTEADGSEIMEPVSGEQPDSLQLAIIDDTV